MTESKTPNDHDDASPLAAATRLLAGRIAVVNVGLQAFAADLDRQGVALVDVQWSPPADGDPELGRLLAALGT